MSLSFNFANNGRVNVTPGVLQGSGPSQGVGATISAWFTPTSSSATTERFVFVYTVNGSNSLARLSISIPVGDFFRVSSRRLDADASSSLCDSAAHLTIGVPVHVVGIVRWSSGVMENWVNGVLSATTTVGTWTGPGSNTVPGGCSIGDKLTNAGPFDGVIGEVRGYSRDILQTEVQSLYNARGRDSVINGLVNRFNMTEQASGFTSANVAPVDDVNSIAGSTVGAPSYANAMTFVRRRRAG